MGRRTKVQKIAYYDAKVHGFKSQAQMRYLLEMARQHEDRYDWVWDVLSDHGVPEKEEALNTYWTGPYKISPDTPSYVYTGRPQVELQQTASLINGLIKLADELDEESSWKQAQKVDEIIARKAQVISPVDEFDAQVVANTFWELWKTEPVESIWQRLESFKDYQTLPSAVQVMVERLISDKLKDR